MQKKQSSSNAGITGRQDRRAEIFTVSCNRIQKAEDVKYATASQLFVECVGCSPVIIPHLRR
jgi:hypothetical protein